MSLRRSGALPLTLLQTEHASDFYAARLGTELLHVPRGSRERLAHFPPLAPTSASVTGRGDCADADLVFSSAGWMSVAVTPGTVVDFRMWTPGGRGAYVRQLPFLANSVNLKGQHHASTQRLVDLQQRQP